MSRTTFKPTFPTFSLLINDHHLSLSLSLSFNDRHLSSSPQDLDNPWIVYNQRSFFESVSTNLVPDEIILGNNVQFVFRCTRLGTHQSFQSDETKVSAESRVAATSCWRREGRGA